MQLQLFGTYEFKLYTPERKLITEWTSRNGTTIEGKNHLLDVYFGGTTPVTTWYIGLIDNAGFSSLAEADTLASHAGWTELTQYTGDRKEWVDAAAASKVKGTTTDASFTFSADKTTYGSFLCGASTGTSAKLFNTSAFSSPQVIGNGSILDVSYSVQM